MAEAKSGYPQNGVKINEVDSFVKAILYRLRRGRHVE